VTILVDTSVWIDHLRRSSSRLTGLLEDALVVIHPFVVGELACGTLADRDQVIDRLGRLESSAVVVHDEALHLVEVNHLWGIGLGWVDAHLIASCLLGGHDLWTRDRPLAEAATRCGVELV
jgi:hypothetical protein